MMSSIALRGERVQARHELFENMQIGLKRGDTNAFCPVRPFRPPDDPIIAESRMIAEPKNLPRWVISFRINADRGIAEKDHSLVYQYGTGLIPNRSDVTEAIVEKSPQLTRVVTLSRMFAHINFKVIKPTNGTVAALGREQENSR